MKASSYDRAEQMLCNYTYSSQVNQRITIFKLMNENMLEKMHGYYIFTGYNLFLEII